MVCYCKKVSEEEIVNAVKEGCTTFDEVKEKTKAGSGCGRCKSKMEQLIEENK